MVMFERVIVVVSMFGLWFVVRHFFLRWQLRRAQHGKRELRGVTLGDGTPHIVYFWSAHCAQCEHTQKPILHRLLAKAGADTLRLTSICVDEEMELARLWGVQTLPTTCVVDSTGVIAHVNNGLASEGKLLRQLKLA